MVFIRTKFCFLVCIIIVQSCSIVFGQKTFFDHSYNNNRILKSEVYFHKNEVVKAIYYDREGRETTSWLKKNNHLAIGKSLVGITKYTGDSVKVEITLYCEIRKDLTFICYSDGSAYRGYYHGFYKKMKTTNQRTVVTNGFVKLKTKKRKFDLDNLVDIEVVAFPENTEITDYFYLRNKEKILLNDEATYPKVFTNRFEDNMNKTYYHRLTYLGNQLVNREFTTIKKDGDGKRAIYTHFPFQEGENAVNKVFKIEIYDAYERIIEIDTGSKKTIFEYIGPYTELRHNHRFVKKGQKELITTFEVQKSFYN